MDKPEVIVLGIDNSIKITIDIVNSIIIELDNSDRSTIDNVIIDEVEFEYKPIKIEPFSNKKKEKSPYKCDGSLKRRRR